MTRTEQHDAMREFSRRCIQAAWDASIDGADVQAWAEELGLIYRDQATRSDCEDHSFEGVPGDEIYRLEEWLRVPSPADGLAGMKHIPLA